MAKGLWGKVYYQETYAGLLQREPGGNHIFTYDPSYLDSHFPPIAFSLPKQTAPFISEQGLHPFFDNLVAEGWLQKAQARALNVNVNDHLALLLGFGFDLPGAVSVIDPAPEEHVIGEHLDNITQAALRSFASLSGVQQKLLVIKEDQTFRPVVGKELSTHIAKLPSDGHPHIIELEYLTTQAVHILLPEDTIVSLEIAELSNIKEPALIVQRFDRTPSGQRVHFEEFNQLLQKPSGDDKYNASYEDMGHFIQRTPQCIPTEAYTLFKRILANFLVGNTDAHLKNFAMFHTHLGLRLTPSYDLVSAACYKRYQTIALALGKEKNLHISLLKPKQLLQMGYEFGLKQDHIVETMRELGQKIPEAISMLEESHVGSKFWRHRLIQMLEKRWKISFDSIGQYLLKKQNKDENLKS